MTFIEGYQKPTESSVLAGLVSGTRHPKVPSDLLPKEQVRPRRPEEYLPSTGQRFEYLELLDRDSVSVSYKVYDCRFDKILAVTFFPFIQLNKAEEAQFARDLEAMCRLRHLNVSEVYSCGKSDDGAPYIVTEIVEGRRMTELMDELKNDIDRALGIFIQLCGALSYAHRQGVTHRDLRPHNVFICQDEDGCDIVKVVNFGVSKTLSDVEGNANALEYRSPEQMVSDVHDQRSDIYSVGCLMHETVTGRLPTKRRAGSATPQSAKKGRKEFEPSIPEQLEICIVRCLEEKPSGRFQNADALLFHLPNKIGGSGRRLSRPVPGKDQGIFRSFLRLFGR